MHIKSFIFAAIVTSTLIVTSCYFTNTAGSKEFAIYHLKSSTEQFDKLLETAIESDRIPRTVNSQGIISFCSNNFDWTQGFFPGLCWQFYEYSGDLRYKEAAAYFQKKFIDHRLLTSNHDLGFVFFNSFGKGYHATKDSTYKKVVLDAANSLSKRFNDTVKCIQSWDIDDGWQAYRGWLYPVIIDNLMNLELLFEASAITGDSKYEEIAIAHANTTLANHFRPDFSSYHVVDYDPETGKIRSKETAQGYAHESSWARGQAWGLYGFTICYRYTMDESYLNAAEKIAAYILNNPNLPDDLIPYWDYNAPRIPNELRDASAASITASALLELNRYSETDYYTSAEKILRNLSTGKYKAQPGSNNNFLLKHSVGSIPHTAEIDVPLIYADYYYVEALIRLNSTDSQLKDINKNL